jgi:hypothetical protein
MSGRASMKSLFSEKAFHTRSHFPLMLICVTQGVTFGRTNFGFSRYGFHPLPLARHSSGYTYYS